MCAALFSGGICAYSNESNPDTVVHHGQYRLGDYFYGNSQYVNKAYNYNFDGTILDEYKKRARHVQDVKALAIAAEVVCKRMKIKALGPATDDMSSREKKIREQKILAWNNNLEGQRSSQTRYAAVHLRLGDVMQKHSHYIFSKYVPAETYEVAAIDLAADGVTAVDLYYAGSATWGVGSHKKTMADTKTAKFVRTVTELFSQAGIAVNVPLTGTADEDMCAMMEAPIFLVAGGGYSRLIRKVRDFLGDKLSPPYLWWCEWLYPSKFKERLSFKALNTWEGPFSKRLNNMRPLAISKCSARAAFLPSNISADDISFNWTDIEEHLNQTLFYPKHPKKFCRGDDCSSKKQKKKRQAASLDTQEKSYTKF